MGKSWVLTKAYFGQTIFSAYACQYVAVILKKGI